MDWSSDIDLVDTMTARREPSYSLWRSLFSGNALRDSVKPKIVLRVFPFPTILIITDEVYDI